MAGQSIHATHVYPRTRTNSLESLLYFLDPQMPHAALLPPPSASPLPEVVGFWRDAGPTLWFARNADFDRRFRERFAHLYELACANALRPAAGEAEDHLGLLLLLDQYPRNAFRGTPRMYASDAQARRWAERALGQGLDRQVGTRCGCSSTCRSPMPRTLPTRIAR